MGEVSDVFDKVSADVDPELLAQWLESSGRFRVLRRVESISDFGGSVSLPLRVLVVDTETTGLVFEQAELVEVGAVLLEVERETGVLGRVLGAYGGLEQPVKPIPEESTAVHGITNEMVRGLRFDDRTLSDLVAQAELCVAHNAGFDKPFLLRRFGCFDETRWACSLKEIPWEQEGYQDRRLGGLLAECGYFHDAHRAVEDCHALIWVLSKALKSSHRMPFQVLFESADLPIYLISALKAPFEKKDVLKARGFRWNADERVWEFEALGFAAGKEVIEWLRSAVYCTSEKVMLGFRAQTGVDRYSGQPTKQQFKEV